MSFLKLTFSGPDVGKQIERAFRALYDEATEYNRWISNHPQEVKNRLRVYEHLTGKPCLSAVLTPQSQSTIYGTITIDGSMPKIPHAYGCDGVCVTLDKETCEALGMPEKLIVKAETLMPHLHVYNFADMSKFFDLGFRYEYWD